MDTQQGDEILGQLEDGRLDVWGMIDIHQGGESVDVRRAEAIRPK